MGGLAVCLSSPIARLNVLSFAKVEGECDIELMPRVGLCVHLKNGSVIDFLKRQRLYVADFSTWKNCSNHVYAVVPKQINMTIAEREHMYTRKEKRRALNAEEFIKIQGYPTESESISMLRDGNIETIPHNVSDVKIFYDIYRPPIEHIRGILRRKGA